MRRSNQPGSGSSAARRRFADNWAEHVEILALDHRPVVVVAEELAAVAAEAAGQPAVVLDGAQRLDELRGARRSTARRCCGCTVPSARRSWRWPAPAGRAPTLRAPPSTGSRRYDGMISSSAAAIASNLSAVVEEAEVANARMCGMGRMRVADQDQRQLSRADRAGRLERTRTAPCSPCSRRCARRRSRTDRGCCTSGGSARGCGSAGISEPTPTTTEGTSGVAGDAPGSWRALPASCTSSARTPRKIGWKIDSPTAAIALGGRHQDRRRGDRTDAVERVVVAIAEEDAEVVVRRVLRQMIDQRRAGRPFGLEPVELVGDRVGLVEDPIGQPAERSADRARA